MGLNYLLHRHQVSLARAHAAVVPEARLCHAAMARAYARRIEDLVGPQRRGETPLVSLA